MKPAASMRNLYREECGRENLCSVVSFSKVVASEWMEGSVAASAVRKRCSLIEVILTDVIVTHRRTLT